MYYPSSENKGDDQLRRYCEADLRLCFRICRLLVFAFGGSYCLSPSESSTCTFLWENHLCFRTNTSSMEKGIEQSKKQLQAIITQVQTFLDMHQVISAGPFLYAFMEEVINVYETIFNSWRSKKFVEIKSNFRLLSLRSRHS